MLALDAFNHCLPPKFIDAVRNSQSRPNVMFDRAVGVFPAMSDLEERFRVLDKFPGYQQILSLASPAIEALAGPDISPELAKIGNDAQAEWVAAHPDRFPGFVAALPLNNPDAALAEIDRAIGIGAAGVQLYTNVNGLPLDRPEFQQLLGRMAELGRPVWLHPLRAATVPDYPGESASKYDIWWALGWPMETAVCMTRLVFAGVFDRWPDLKIITHHAGGMIPMMEGRLDSGLQLFREQYPASPDVAQPILHEPPVEAFRRFYADTATFGSSIAIEAGESFFGTDKMVFATDFPFDHELGAAHIRNTLDAIDEIGLTDTERDAILHGNLQLLLAPTKY